MSNFEIHDKYFHLAKQQGLKARSAFKLIQIQEKFKIIKKQRNILDLGCYPGSWIQTLKRITSSRAEIIGFDLQKCQDLNSSNVKTFQTDIYDDETIKEILQNKKFDLITADLAPSTSGIKDLDQARSVELNIQVLNIAKKHLNKNGDLISKIFIGSDFQEFLPQIKKEFKTTKLFAPPATRKSSSEQYIIAKSKI